MNEKKVKMDEKNKNNNKINNIKPHKKAESSIIVIAVLVVCIISAIVIILFEYNKQLKEHQSLFNYDKEFVLDEDELTDEQKDILGIDKKTKDDKNEVDYNLYDGDDEFTKKLLDEKAKKIKEENYSNNYKIYDKLTDEQKKKSEVIPKEQKVPDEKLDEIKEELDTDIEIPRKFNLNDKIKIKVEDQENYGLCWAFAGTKSVETYLALRENKFYDLSEIHVDYLMSDLMFGNNRKIHNGGNSKLYNSYLKKFGPINTDNLEYRDFKTDEYLKFTDYKPVVNVTKTVFFPDSPAQNGGTLEEINEFRNLVKTHIMKNGSLYAGIANPADEDYYNFKTQSLFYDGTKTPSCFHAISIVGWDDDYSKDNFHNSSGAIPKNNGAYLALDSDGEGGRWTSDYFYISYEDILVENDLFGILSTSNDNLININSIKSKSIKNYFYNNYSFLIETIDGEEYLNPVSLDNLRYIDLSNSGLKNEDLSELNVFSDLEHIVFNLSDNNLTDISLLSDYKNKFNVEEINISNNKISDLTPLKNFNNLMILEAENNEIVDISPLSGNEKLYSININNNKVSDLTSLKNIKKISSVYINNNNISDINFINDIKNLYIELSGNPINWQDVNLNNSTINSINLSNTNLDSLKRLEGLENLNSLKIMNNDLKDLEGLDKLKLSYLYISGNNIKDWSLIKNLKSRIVEISSDYSYETEVSLVAENCNIEDISIFNNTDISRLILNDNNIKDLSVFNNNKTITLKLSNNKLEDISGFDASHISYIDLSKNLNISGLESIKNVSTVILSENGFTNLDEVKKLTGVGELDISKNNIKDLSNLNNFEYLHTLSIEENTSVDISTVPNKPIMLNARNCNIQKDLEYSDINNLVYLNLSGNNKMVDLDSFITGTGRGERPITIEIFDRILPLDMLEKAEKSKKVYFNFNIVSVPYNSNETTMYLPYDSWLQKNIRHGILYNYNFKLNDLEINDNVTKITFTGENPYIELENADLLFGVKIIFEKEN